MSDQLLPLCPQGCNGKRCCQEHVGADKLSLTANNQARHPTEPCAASWARHCGTGHCWGQLWHQDPAMLDCLCCWGVPWGRLGGQRRGLGHQLADLVSAVWSFAICMQVCSQSSLFPAGNIGRWRPALLVFALRVCPRGACWGLPASARLKVRPRDPVEPGGCPSSREGLSGA